MEIAELDFIWQNPGSKDISYTKIYVSRTTHVLHEKNNQRAYGNSIIYRFIWKGCDKIKRLALISDYKNGGLRMPHVKTLIDTQRIICLKKYIEDYDSPWKHFLLFFLKDYGVKFLLYCNFNPADLPDHIHSFYKDCLDVWSKLTAKSKSSGTINSYASTANLFFTEDYSQRVSLSFLTFWPRMAS